MKKVIRKEVTLCDACGRETYIAKCLGCGVEHCYDCQKQLGVEYRHGVSFSGSGDGYFCLKCDANPPEKVRGLHSTYQIIKRLRYEADGYYQYFDETSKEAEAHLMVLYNALVK